ncbi:MAG: hypothetical protein AAF389_05740 [Gemmatimonadota bacterium]
MCTLVSCGGQPPAGEAACAAEVATRLEALGVDPQSGETRSGPDGSEIHFPEQPRGAHVSVAVLEGAPVVTLRSPEGVSRWHFADGCHEPRMTVSLSDLPVEGARFTDADLEAARRAHPGGVVVYAWSPHMPLSVDGLPEVAEAARDAGFGFEPVLIAPGDTSFARAELLRVGGPEAALRRIASVELLTRELQVHAPALLVFSADRVSPVLPGYRNAEGYRRFLEAFVEGR